MIPSYRTPATICMTAGGMLFGAGIMLPKIFIPPPDEVLLISAISPSVAAVVFGVGCCLYCRGNGYPAWLGLFGLTCVGLLILMLLPDRFPEQDADDV